MLINSDIGIVGAIAWDKQSEVDPMSYALSGVTPREWAESQGLEWLDFSAGKEWVVSLKEKTEHRVLLVCETKLKPEPRPAHNPISCWVCACNSRKPQ